MISFPNAKINLGLQITGKRDDGFHNIETVFYPIKLSDALEIIIATDKSFQFQNSGLIIPGDPDKNLCVDAYNLLAADFKIPAVKISLHKKIPTGAGLGGGSSDAAHTLILLDKIFSLGLGQEELKNYARKLGSDCAFFIENSPCYAYGRGDQFEPLEINTRGYYIAIVKPDFSIGTQEAYSEIKVSRANSTIKSIVTQSINTWRTNLCNEFESSIFNKYPELDKIKKKLYEHGAVYASMSGSGSAVYGIFKGKPSTMEFSPSYFYWDEVSGLDN
ncbi:MAG: 4-(cytidine 5'-diphospho)-2-C-methyl-D-erythritol kinase [Bacteroidales bacterium]|nr:4-(cytidine 5'-diphospho)-2-C-methyl-D-erythritol kinase [Bacteroidales bacterium]